PMYIAEIAPAQMRGKLVSINQLTIVTGVLSAQLINWWLVRDLPHGASDEFIVNSWYGQSGWRWMFAITAIPAVLFFVGMFFVAAGYDISTVLKHIAWTGSVNLAFTFVALGTVDRFGRRPLMLIGAAGLAVIYTAVGLCYHNGVQGLPVLLLVLSAIACYSIS